MNKLEQKFDTAAKENGWEIHWHDDGKFIAVLHEDLRTSGYPWYVCGQLNEDSMEWGKLINDYGTGEESYVAGMRYILDVFKNVQNPLKYKPFYDRYLEAFPNDRSEKVMSERSGISERQIRKARMCGFADPFVLDALCTRLLKLSPMFIYGADEWHAGVDVDFEDDWEAWQEEYRKQQEKK